MSSEISRRKDEHIALASSDAVAFRQRTTLLEQVTLIHESLPELALDEIDLGTELLGKTLRAPIVIASMTGGTERAGSINRELASIAEARGYAIGLGSQRAMMRDPSMASTYRVRDVAPTALLLGNLGVVQARDLATADILRLIDDVGADALCLHMNPAQEVVQTGGDRDFRGGLETFARLAGELKIPVIAKETGCGVSARVAAKLRDVGVKTVDVSGAGGTSWVAVETLRAQGAAKDLGESFWDWGIPTAVSVAWVARAGLAPIATGGIKSGLDVARAIALGARAAGIARPVLQALQAGGRAGAEAFLDRVEAELRTAMLLCGAGTLDELRNAPRVLGPELSGWIGTM
ncbi:type 2 isopentenyl-diphosphate Delta-isomerase [Sandaracinus amylolyticus]|uniref:type 2 isopentenyl-diphosphate Delta-isomerase n=1 Tax=Sandaracinus amylolyticus TaxID=927083 RepID=UPI001F2CE4E6|nr:type 2 isopentenyl-diphosphate Delta-isomerase [Sandaracinus amylolyticus]UJR83863.1 Hypothetical protein I5071_59340 [Sandaracinus amylolyticus]